MSASLPQLDSATYSSQLFWLVISFSILYFAISRFFLPNIQAIIEKRADFIENNSQEVAIINKEITELEDKYNLMKIDTHREINNMIANVNNKADEITKEGNLLIAQNLKILNNKLTSDIKTSLETSEEILRENAFNISEILFNKFFGEKIDQNQLNELSIIFEKYLLKEKLAKKYQQI